jgi:hypothetical protein
MRWSGGFFDTDSARIGRITQAFKRPAKKRPLRAKPKTLPPFAMIRSWLRRPEWELSTFQPGRAYMAPCDDARRKAAMTYEELRAAREFLGLSPAEAAELLETDLGTIRRIEAARGKSTARSAPARVAQLYRAYLSGFRPANWPKRLRGREERLAEIEEIVRTSRS